MSDTPRTDRAQFASIPDAGRGSRFVVEADFSRRLERERNALDDALRERDKQVIALDKERGELAAERDEQFERANEWRDQAEKQRLLAETAKRDCGQAWDAFKRLRRAYAMVRYPTLNEEIILLYDTADAAAHKPPEETLDTNNPPSAFDCTWPSCECNPPCAQRAERTT